MAAVGYTYPVLNRARAVIERTLSPDSDAPRIRNPDISVPDERHVSTPSFGSSDSSDLYPGSRSALRAASTGIDLPPTLAHRCLAVFACWCRTSTHSWFWLGGSGD